MKSRQQQQALEQRYRVQVQTTESRHAHERSRHRFTASQQTVHSRIAQLQMLSTNTDAVARTNTIITAASSPPISPTSYSTLLHQVRMVDSSPYGAVGSNRPRRRTQTKRSQLLIPPPQQSQESSQWFDSSPVSPTMMSSTVLSPHPNPLPHLMVSSPIHHAPHPMPPVPVSPTAMHELRFRMLASSPRIASPPTTPPPIYPRSMSALASPASPQLQPPPSPTFTSPLIHHHFQHAIPLTTSSTSSTALSSSHVSPRTGDRDESTRPAHPPRHNYHHSLTDFELLSPELLAPSPELYSESQHATPQMPVKTIQQQQQPVHQPSHQILHQQQPYQPPLASQLAQQPSQPSTAAERRARQFLSRVQPQSSRLPNVRR